MTAPATRFSHRMPLPVKCWRSATAAVQRIAHQPSAPQNTPATSTRRVGQAGADAGEVAAGEGRAERHHGQRIEDGDEEARGGVVEVRRDLVLAVVGHRIADGAQAMAHGRPAHDRPAPAPPMPRSQAFAAGDEILDEGQAEGGDRAEHRIAQRRAEAGQVARRRRRP